MELQSAPPQALAIALQWWEKGILTNYPVKRLLVLMLDAPMPTLETGFWASVGEKLVLTLVGGAIEIEDCELRDGFCGHCLMCMM
jgi:hypothetical protein